MTDSDTSPDDPLDDLVRAALATPPVPAEVRARHRSELGHAIAAGGRDVAPRRHRPRRPFFVAAAAAAVVGAVAVGVAVAGDDPDREQVAAGRQGSDGDRAPAGAPVSPACGGRPVPFAVPLDERFGPITSGPAPGAPAPDVDGQLVLHWASPDTAVELRWPADASQRMLDQLGETRADMAARLADGLSPASYTDSDLNLDLTGPAGAPTGHSVGYRGEVELDGTYELAVTRSDLPDPSTKGPTGPTPQWGDGLCAVVQLTVVALDGRDDVRPEAEALYDALLAPGGPLLPAQPTLPLVAARTEAHELPPVSECRVPPGIEQDPVRRSRLDGPGPRSTPDEALAAYLETTVVVDEGPFGPVERLGVPEAGYTAVSLPDGRVAFRLPSDHGMVAYLFAEKVHDGWSITAYEGPSC